MTSNPKQVAQFFILLLVLLLTSGCATGVGYVLGHSVDQELRWSEIIPVDSVATIPPGQQIFVTAESGQEINLIFVDTDTTTTMTVRSFDDPVVRDTFLIALDKVERIRVPHESTKTRMRMAGIGLAVDVTIAIACLFWYSSTKGRDNSPGS